MGPSMMTVVEFHNEAGEFQAVEVLRERRRHIVACLWKAFEACLPSGARNEIITVKPRFG